MLGPQTLPMSYPSQTHSGCPHSGLLGLRFSIVVSARLTKPLGTW